MLLFDKVPEQFPNKSLIS